MSKTVEVNVIKSYTGKCLAIDDLRVCGSKPCGEILDTFYVSIDDLKRIVSDNEEALNEKED
jgi:hypothetical protein